MDFFEVIDSRKTIRNYDADIPPIEDIKKIINAGRLAPSATNAQNWEFIAIYNEKIRIQMARAVENTYDELIETIQDETLHPKIVFYKKYSSFIEHAPVIIAAIVTPKVSHISNIIDSMNIPLQELEQMRPDTSLLSMGAAIENMSLAAHALNYGSCWMCAPILAYKKLKEILDISEENKLVSLLAIGKPLNDDTQSPLKKSLDDVMKVIR